MKRFLLLSGLVAAFTLSSCKKDPVVEPTKVLKKITVIGDGQTIVYNLSYDANKRLVSMKGTDNIEYAFTYSTSGNLGRIELFSPGQKYVKEFFYTDGIPSSGKLTVAFMDSDGSYVENGHIISPYIVTGNQVSTIGEYNLSYADGNVAIREVNRGAKSKIRYQYDDGKAIFPKLSDFVLDCDYDFPMYFFSKHNVVVAGYYDGDNTQPTTVAHTEYTYDADGYALTSDNGEIQNSFEYE